MIGAAHADAGGRGLNKIILFIGLANLAGNGANAALVKLVGRALAAVFFAVKTISRDSKFGIGTYYDRAAIVHFELGQGGHTRHDHVALADLAAFNGSSHIAGFRFDADVAIHKLKFACGRDGEIRKNERGPGKQG